MFVGAGGTLRVVAYRFGRETILIAVRAADGRRVMPGDADHGDARALIDRAALELRAAGRRVDARQKRRAYAGLPPARRPGEAAELVLVRDALDTLAIGLRRSAVVGAWHGGRLAAHAGVYARLVGLRDVVAAEAGAT